MKSPLTFIVLGVLFADLLFRLVLNVKHALLPDDAALSPEWLFGWLPVAANAAMTVLLAWGAYALRQYQLANRRRIVLPLHFGRLFGVAVAAAFGLPALPLWLHALTQMQHIAAAPVYQLASTACQPVLSALCLHALWRQWRLYRTGRAAPPPTRIPPPPATVWLPPEDFRN